MPIITECKQCGKEIKSKPFTIKRGGGKFCSRSCQGRYKWTGKGNPKYSGALLSKDCAQCGETFPVFLSRIKGSKNNGKFCSYSCKFRHEQMGNKNNNWKGGRFSADGYIALSGHGRKRFYEHTFVAESILGRRLKKDEVVHHINGIKDDNRNCNLLICGKAYHHWLHHRMAKLYQREHFGHI